NVINQTQVMGDVNIVNNTVINNVVNVTYVEEKTQQQVVEHELVVVASESQADQADQVEGQRIELYQPSAEQLMPTEAPEEVTEADQVAQEVSPPEVPPGEATTEDLVPPPPSAGEEPPPTLLPGAEEPEAAAEEAGPPPPPAD